MYVSGVAYESLVDGIGVRATIFISGCSHHCKGCQNPQTQNFKNGQEFTTELQQEIINKIKNNPLIRGITLSGGDPMFSAREVIDFVKLAKSQIRNINLWCYTGFTYEEILNSGNTDRIELLKMCDVIVDGRFVLERKDITLSFKGSTNQRVIDIRKSLAKGKVVEL